MKNKELIEKLSALNPDNKVFIVGYEGGLEMIVEIKESKMVLNVNDEEWLGPHDDFHKTKVIDSSRIVDGIILIGEKNRKP